MVEVAEIDQLIRLNCFYRTIWASRVVQLSLFPLSRDVEPRS